MQSARGSSEIFITLEFFLNRVFGKYSNIKFHENPSGGNRAVPRGRKDMAT